MKHLDYSDKTKGLTGLKGLIVLTFSVFLSFSTLLTSCSKYDEVDFAGIIIDTRKCTLFDIRPNVGYLVQLSSPTDYGVTYTSQYGITYDNVVILYDPDCLLYLYDTIKGAFYLDSKYARANCSIHWDVLDDIPMGVFTVVSVD